MCDCRYIATVCSGANSKPPVAAWSHHDIPFIATAGVSPNCIAIWKLSSSGKELLNTLTRHSRAVLVLVVAGESDNALLCSASEDIVLVWNLCLPDCSAAARRLQIPSSGVVTAVSFSSPASYLAVCIGNDCLVFNTEGLDIEATLADHTNTVTCAEFLSHRPSLVVTGSKDRTFKVWDIADGVILYHSEVLSASPINCLTLDERGTLMCIGCEDGQLKVYDVSEVNRCAYLYTASTLAERNDAIGSPSPQAVCFWRYSVFEETETNDSGACNTQWLSELRNEILSLTVVLPNALLIFNAYTGQLIYYLDFREGAISLTEPSIPAYKVPTTSSTAFITSSRRTSEMLCCLGSEQDGSISVLCVQTVDNVGQDHLSVLSSAPVMKNSILKAELVPKSPKDQLSKTIATGVLKSKQKTLHDHPLVFKTKIRSSGYTQSPRMTMFQPRTKPKTKPSQPISHPKTSQKDPDKLVSPPYLHFTDRVSLQHSLQLLKSPVPIFGASYNREGSQLACATGDKAVHLIRSSSYSQNSLLGCLSANNMNVDFTSHDGAVMAASWSHSNQLLLTGSADKTACVWQLNDPQHPVALSITTTAHNFKKSTDAALQSNIPFPKEITHSSFYYLDKLILLVSANTVYTYKYYIDYSKPDDLKRYCTNSRYKLVKPVVMESTQTITALACNNDFHSYLLFTAGSNKSIQVYDMNTAQAVRTIYDPHDRVVNCIALNKGSVSTALPNEAYDLFLSSAVGSGVKLWDIRTDRCVRWFTGHQNRSQPVSAVFSPCGRFIATGSDDRAACVYDLRHQRPLHRLITPRSPVVSGVTYHPSLPMLTACTLDGSVYYFSEDKEKI